MYENQILEFTKEDGTVERKLLEQIFTVPNGTEYAALLALNEDGSWDDEQPIELVRAVPTSSADGTVDYSLEPIESDEEFRIAHDKYAEAFSGISDEEDDSEIKASDTVPHVVLDGEDYYMVDAFEIEGRKYVALCKTVDEDKAEIPIDLYRFSANELEDGEDVEITPIPSDMEYEEVIKVFSERIENGVTWL